ncbi:hypothetical protein KBD49_12285 [Myxococcota bacterium]|nr:hypothetical protein [Myxococcota bacterium]
MRGAVRVLAVLGSLWMFGCDDASPGVTDLGPDAPACAEQRLTGKKAACERFQAVLCDRLVEGCDAFPDLAGCLQWFVGQYGDCAKAQGDLSSPAADAMQKCLCDLPNASCQALQDMGAEGAVQSCAAW